MNKNRLELLRDEKELKAKDIANYLKVGESSYSEWENNKSPIPTKRIIELANFYEVNIDYMLKLSNSKYKIDKINNINLILIGTRLKNIRKELGLTLRDLGNKLNCSYSAIGSYERGERLINCEILISFAKYSKHSIDYILGRTNNK